LAVLFYLRADVFAISRAMLSMGQHDRPNAALGLMLILATIPVVLAGYVVNYADIKWLELVSTLAFANLGFAALLWRADRAPALHKDVTAIGWRQAVIIGLAQICALMPGASRSGVTMTAARFLGFDRVVAARFSLLLSLPVIAGAGLLKGKDLVVADDFALGVDAAVVAVLSAVLALVAIRWMMGWLTRASFAIFVYYRLALGGVLLLLLALGQISPSLS